MKYLSVDYGAKKCGIAVSDDRGTIAVPLKILPTEQLEAELDHMLSNVLFERIVFGESVNSKGIHNTVWTETNAFVNKLKEKYEARIINGELSIHFEKEFLTSKHARYLDNEKDVDDRAAALILQRFLDKQNAKHQISDEEKRKIEELEQQIADNEDM
jgi:putative holliday junction resolvase